MDPQLRKAALEYHELGSPGKISVTPTKQLVNQRDLALAYSPGVAAACEEIVADPANAFRYTARGNLVGVNDEGTTLGARLDALAQSGQHWDALIQGYERAIAADLARATAFTPFPFAWATT